MAGRPFAWVEAPLWPLGPYPPFPGVSEDHHLHAGGGKRGQPAGLRVVLRAGTPGRRELECTGPPPDGEPEHRPETNVLQGIEVKQVVFDLTMLRNALWPGSVLFTGRTSPAAHFRQHKGRADCHEPGKGEKEQHERHPVRHGGKGRTSGSAGRL